jgi:hypothetical protein
MRPSSVEMVRSIEHSFETYVVPELEHPLATSAAAGIKNLLRHLTVRIEAEPELLFRDSQEKRRLCAGLAASLRSNQGALANPTLASLAEHLEAAATRQYREPEEFPSLASLAEENADLKEVVDRAVRDLHAHKKAISTAECEHLSGLIREQLHQQMEREIACFDTSYTGPMF